MTKPVLILDPGWRQMDELFSPAVRAAVFEEYEVVWGRDGAIPSDVYEAALPRAEVLISSSPHVDKATLDAAPHLRAIIEVSGAFPETIDYTACFASGVEVLSCAPGFRRAVAEMGLAMVLAGARGLVSEHEAMRSGQEHWLADRPDTDFTLFGASVGFIGFGQIGQELARLLAPFEPVLTAYDPWLPEEVAQDFGVRLAGLDDVIAGSRCLFVTAVPTADNHHLLNAERLARLQDNALLILLSRAHLVDFDALVAELSTNRIRACIDVFPTEPVAQDDPIRRLSSVILSPHRAAAVDKGRQLIGDMILSDLRALRRGVETRRLAAADPDRIASLSGVGDADKVATIALAR